MCPCFLISALPGVPALHSVLWGVTGVFLVCTSLWTGPLGGGTVLLEHMKLLSRLHSGVLFLSLCFVLFLLEEYGFILEYVENNILAANNSIDLIIYVKLFHFGGCFLFVLKI